MALDDAGAVYMGLQPEWKIGPREVDSWGKSGQPQQCYPQCRRVLSSRLGTDTSVCHAQWSSLHLGLQRGRRLGIRTTVDACTPQRVSLPGKPKVATVSCGVAIPWR